MQIIMAKEINYFKRIFTHVEKKYGGEKARAIMAKARERYDAIVEENKDEPKAHHIHTRERIYPGIAMFDAMTAEGISREEAADFIVGCYRWRAGKMSPIIKAIFKMPGLYRIVPKFFLSMTAKTFGPQMGFEAKNKHLGKNEMRFDMVKCPYYEKCMQYGCPEIVKGYCEADDILYGDMHPKLLWGRTQTLGKGGSCCDFKISIINKKI